MDQILEQLFESVPKIRLLRLFLRNADSHFPFAEVLRISQLRRSVVSKELKKLLHLGIVKSKIAKIQWEVRRKSRSRRRPPKVIVKSKKERVFFVNTALPIFSELRALVSRASVVSRSRLSKKMAGLGKIKLAVVSGVFLNNDNSRTDLLLVGDHVKRGRLDSFLAELESELGQALRYALMDTDEFKYRLDMYDRFLRDILEYPHEKLINKLHI